MFTLKPTEDRAAAMAILCEIFRRGGFLCTAEVGKAAGRSFRGRQSDPSAHQTRSREERGREHRRLRADAGRGSTRQPGGSVGAGHRHNQAGGDSRCGHGHTEAHPTPWHVPLVLPVPLLAPGPGEETTVR